jgi:hypothetical protein
VRRRWLAALTLATVALALALLVVRDPHQAGAFPACPVRAATGLLCPGCGSLRGLWHVLHGEPLAALAHNPAILLGVVALAVVVWRALRVLVGWPPPARPPVRRAWIWLLVGALVAFTIARNLTPALADEACRPAQGALMRPMPGCEKLPRYRMPLTSITLASDA